MTTLERRIEAQAPVSLRARIGSTVADLRSIPERLRGSEYLRVGQSARFRAVQRRRVRSAIRVGCLVVALADAFDAAVTIGLQADGTAISLGVDLATIAVALGGWWAVGGRLRHHPEAVAWILSLGIAISDVVTEIAAPGLAIQSIGYLLVLPGLIALVLPWRTKVHVRWLLAMAAVSVTALALGPGDRLTADERGDLVVVLFVALGASLAGHVLLQRAQIRSFVQLEGTRVLHRRADADRIELERAQHALELTARIDPLTGANNRRRLEEDLRAVRAHIDRSGMIYGLLMIDLDRFKAINDLRGHLAGDDVLRRVAAAIRASLRADDAVYRYGGEEFVAILAVSTADRLFAAAERLRLIVAALEIEHVDNPPSDVVSISVGATLIGRFNLDLSVDQWLGQSDAALYAAKAGGRNTVRLAAIPTALPEPVLMPGQTDRESAVSSRAAHPAGLRGALARTPRRRSTD
ncbi:MAG: GGDEF domain-containing protein [Candidatus Limnocylindrales bacterium]